MEATIVVNCLLKQTSGLVGDDFFIERVSIPI